MFPGNSIQKVFSRTSVELDIFSCHLNLHFTILKNGGGGKNNGFHKLIELAKGKRIAFDVGAHIGICSLTMSRDLGNGGTCYAFEPAEANRKYLKTHYLILKMLIF